MHKTPSLDFAILFEGKIDWYEIPPLSWCLRINVNESVLDDEVIHMKPGDVCIQRGTIHAWRNTEETTARLYCVLMSKILRPEILRLFANVSCFVQLQNHWKLWKGNELVI